jgi:hypothetical protein
LVRQHPVQDVTYTDGYYCSAWLLHNPSHPDKRTEASPPSSNTLKKEATSVYLVLLNLILIKTIHHT